MICKHSESNKYFIYKFIDKNTVEISNGNFSKNITYESWLNNFFIVDKLRSKLMPYELVNINSIEIDLWKKIKSFNFFEYVVDKYNNIWKYVKSKDHFIKVTPWEKEEDRRINRFEIERLIESGELV